ncbi:hypothetical protein DSM112329_02301 [Paraconexibacter sp. AEG42_29]|uniref:Uncharacterized protein n=1 Tax=Paraconexibacter sp. AEG42_29 TaxID=2997339 RepID=A0AAU7AV13_9ACTN
MILVVALALFVIVPLLTLVASLGRTAISTPSKKAQKLATEESFGSARLEAAAGRKQAPRATVMAGRPVVAAPVTPAVSRPIGSAATANADVLQFPARPTPVNAPARLADIVRTAGA